MQVGQNLFIFYANTYLSSIINQCLALVHCKLQFKTSLIRLCSHTSFRTSSMYVVARPQAKLKVAIFYTKMAHGKTKQDTVLKLTHKMHNVLLQIGAKHGIDWIIRDGAF